MTDNYDKALNMALTAVIRVMIAHGYYSEEMVQAIYSDPAMALGETKKQYLNSADKASIKECADRIKVVAGMYLVPKSAVDA